MKRSMSANGPTFSIRWQPALWTYARPKPELLGAIMAALSRYKLTGGTVGVTISAYGIGLETSFTLEPDQANTVRMLVDFIIETHRQAQDSRAREIEDFLIEISEDEDTRPC